MSAPTASPLGARVRLAILGLGITQIVGWGTTYYLLSLLGGPIARELELPRAAVLAGVSMTLAGAAILGPMVGRWQDRAGSRLVMCAGSATLAAGLLALSFASGPLTYYVGWALIALGTPMSLYNAAFTAMTQLAGRNARRAIIYLTFLGGLASTIAWPITATLLESMDWRAIVRLFAATNLLLCLPLHAVLLGGHAERNGGKGGDHVEQGLPDHALRIAFLALSGLLALNSIIFNAWSLLVFPVLEGLNFESGLAVTVASTVGICQVLGRMGEMALGGRFSAISMAVFAIALLPVSFVILYLSNGGVLMGFIFALAYGVSNGLVTIARGALTLVIFGSRGYGERFGKVTVASGITGASAPILAGLGLDAFGVAQLIVVLFFIACGSLALMLLLRAHCARHGLR
jgi:MFS family permease